LIAVPDAIRPQLLLDTAGPSLAGALAHAAAARREAGGAPTDDTTPAEPLLYRTGDLARVLPSGELQVLGRADSTVKIRGFKIGLGFVEATLSALPGVGRVAVVPLNDEETGQPIALVAHVLPNADAAAAAEADEKGWLASLRDACRKELATHSVPAHWMVTKELGLSAGESRKLNQAAAHQAGGRRPRHGQPARLGARAPDGRRGVAVGGARGEADAHLGRAAQPARDARR
jgi:acyl-CoA synthetase (AMP-forming)/AMP-acid ligase II